MADPRPLDQRIQKLEELVAYQDHEIKQLNQVLIKLRSEYDHLVHRFSMHQERLKWLMDRHEEHRDLVDEKPPHY